MVEELYVDVVGDKVDDSENRNCENLGYAYEWKSGTKIGLKSGLKVVKGLKIINKRNNRVRF